LLFSGIDRFGFFSEPVRVVPICCGAKQVSNCLVMLGAYLGREGITSPSSDEFVVWIVGLQRELSFLNQPLKA
jgi:hypothetical protein